VSSAKRRPRPTYKLGKYGINGDLLCWLKSYFSNRTQRVMIKDALSGIGHLHAGVPQGSGK
jgi:hypothetical protein